MKSTKKGIFFVDNFNKYEEPVNSDKNSWYEFDYIKHWRDDEGLEESDHSNRTRGIHITDDDSIQTTSLSNNNAWTEEISNKNSQPWGARLFDEQVKTFADDAGFESDIINDYSDNEDPSYNPKVYNAFEDSSDAETSPSSSDSDEEKSNRYFLSISSVSKVKDRQNSCDSNSQNKETNSTGSSRNHGTKCPKCKKILNTSYLLNTHIDTVHKGLKKYECTICLKKFSQEGDMRRHITSVHRKFLPHTCLQCKKAFRRQSDLDRHYFSVHKSDEIPHSKFKCKLCDRHFFKAYILTQHLRENHKKGCTFSCDVCSKIFSSNYKVRFHKQWSHNIDCGITLYHCKICKRKFHSIQRLMQHKEKDHEDLSSSDEK